MVAMETIFLWEYGCYGCFEIFLLLRERMIQEEITLRLVQGGGSIVAMETMFRHLSVAMGTYDSGRNFGAIGTMIV